MSERYAYKDTVGIMRLEKRTRSYRSNISGGSTEQSFQNEASARLPDCHCFKFSRVAAICPPSAESKTITTPPTAGSCEEISRYAVTRSDFAKFRLAKTEAGFPCADAGPVQIILTVFPVSGSQWPLYMFVSSRTTRKIDSGAGAASSLFASTFSPSGKIKSERRIQPREAPEICTCIQSGPLSRT